MKKSTLSMLLGATMLATIGTTASAAPRPAMMGTDPIPGCRMRKAQPEQRWSSPTTTSGQRQKRINSHFTSPASDVFEYLYAPDGTIMYAVTEYDTEEIKYEYYTEYEKKGFTITFYDSQFNEIGKIRDKIDFQEGEIKCVEASLCSQVTKQFFNYDGNYEVMISLFMNTEDFINNIRTLSYSITPLADGEYSTPISVTPGYPVDQVNCAKDKWSEDFYITFLTDYQPEDPGIYPDLLDYLSELKQTLTTYGKGGTVVMEKSVRNLDLPGDQMTSPMMLCKNVDGHLVLTYASYEKSFFENPAGMSDNEKITEDNNLIIETYRMNDAWPREMELLSTTKIEAKQHNDNPDIYCTFYGIGNLMWDQDVDFGHYTSDGRPAYIISVDDCLYSDDDHYTSAYYVYDADGNRLSTIAENTYDYVMMSDLPGFEPQVMFIHMGDDMNFEFVDVYSCEKVTEFDHQYRGYGLSTSLDRVACGDTYVYASALSTGIPLDDTHLAAPVCWIDTNGDMIRLDLIPTGEGVELAQIYMNSNGLKPFLFNTDEDMEYMLLVKRRVAGSNALKEELLIATTQNGVLHTITEDANKGAIRSVMLMDGSDPELLVVYLDNNYKYTADAYALPFSKFAGGAGTAADPYLIATAGDLQQIKSAPAAYYKLTDDIDCSSLDYYPIAEFKGTLDGDGHVVSNLKLVTPTNGKTALFTSTDKATVKNIDFYNAKMLLSGAYEAGLIAATAGNSTFDNIHVRRLTVTGDSYAGEFGGIAGKMWTNSVIKGCEVAGADINLPSCPSAGGMTGDIRTGCIIKACAFSGKMTANNTLGGIVGSTTTGDEEISFCHVDADLKAENTVGGIVGFLDRSKVISNYVEGTIEATKPSKWNKSIALGGIAGELEGDWQGTANVPVVNNLIGVSALIYPDLTAMTEDFPRQLSTVHRVVGRTSYNNYFEEEPSKIVYESGIYNNLVVSDIPVIDQEFAERSVEGTTTDKYEVEIDTLNKQLGFEFGTSSDSPWNNYSWYAYDPSLYYESLAYIPGQEISVANGSTFGIEIAVLSREELTEDDIIGGFMCEYDESVIQMTGNMSYDGKTMIVEMSAINEGETNFSVSILGNSAACKVKVIAGGNAVESVDSDSISFTVSNGMLSAEGCNITIFDINGKALLSGFGRVNANDLADGIYVATAVDNNGKTKAIKFVK